jgi:hypothetical protein
MKKIFLTLIIVLSGCNTFDIFLDGTSKEAKSIGYELIEHPTKLLDLNKNFSKNYDSLIISDYLLKDSYRKEICNYSEKIFSSSLSNVNFYKVEFQNGDYEVIQSWNKRINIKEYKLFCYTFCRFNNCLDIYFLIRDDKLFIYHLKSNILSPYYNDN